MRAPLRFTATPSGVARGSLRVCATLLFATVAASCAPTRPATRVEVIRPPAAAHAETATPAPVPPAPAPVIDVDPDVVTSAVLPPGATLPSVAPDATDNAPSEALPAPPTSNVVALILPLDVPAYERAASAVRDGFMDAAEAAGKRAD
jgi:hypothetical protein